jgi:hypothetical protein
LEWDLRSRPLTLIKVTVAFPHLLSSNNPIQLDHLVKPICILPLSTPLILAQAIFMKRTVGLKKKKKKKKTSC